MNVLKKLLHTYLPALFVAVCFNLYFIFLMREQNTAYLLYLDILLGIALSLAAVADGLKCRRQELGKKERLAEEAGVKEALRARFDENCDLQDYVAKWCHEMKLPLSAGLLLTEQIRDVPLRGQLREQFERMKQQINGMLLGCKLQSALFDLQIQPASLSACVRTSVRNNQFFLIRKKTTLDVSVPEELTVYTDPSWLVYILDQLLSNAVKYTGEAPVIRIAAGREGEVVSLSVEDNGTGILPEDLRRVFEKGFTGSNHHNGKYRSTGMGLYMAKKIADRMGHELSVESEYGAYTRCCLRFHEHDYFRF